MAADGGVLHPRMGVYVITIREKLGFEMDVTQIPVVDIGGLMSFPTDEDLDAALGDPAEEALHEIVKEIAAAARAWGFFYIGNHSVPKHDVDQFQAAMRSFFRLPTSVKSSIRRRATNARGYFNDELTKHRTDWKECLDFGSVEEDTSPGSGSHERLGEDANQWPEEKLVPGFRQVMRHYFGQMEHLSRRLLKVFAVALGAEPAFFDPFFDRDSSSFLRLNHYPVAPEPAMTMGVHHHTDAGALTILLQDDQVASLQVYHRDSQTWTLVPSRKDTFTINIGDMLQVWSNDKFIAPLHRVLAHSDADRFSAPFFYNPSYKTHVKPIVLTEGEEPKYRSLSWREFRLARFQGDYANRGKEIQIDDFRIHKPINVSIP
ncbi:hypothetical protein PsorP6_016265 [Peronosclerospora sorghi]|uniref:Uncharacterized protein n=1 Tax=Peronosclerospora sorghi TaxID=230839 RepID=A0ACC0VJU4_9STRA|nr:hypothetical protein PsorP6_016265 [Peronosclerospora sorghi]